jgi:hypothetical protein
MIECKLSVFCSSRPLRRQSSSAPSRSLASESINDPS